MESETKQQLPLFSFSLQPISEPSGMLTPPLETPASVPFRWEEEPGKPRPCTALVVVPNPKRLDLPPRLLPIEPRLITKTPSPTAVLDGPYFSSFRLTSHRSMEGEFYHNKKSFGLKGIMRKFIKGKNKEASEGSMVISPSGSTEEESNNARIRRSRSFSSLSANRSHSHLWTTIHEGFKHVIPWKKSSNKHKERLNSTAI